MRGFFALRAQRSRNAANAAGAQVSDVGRASFGREVRPGLGEDGAKLCITERREIIARTLEIAAIDIPCGSRQPSGHMHDEHTPALVVEFLDGDSVTEPLVKARFGATGCGKRLRAYDLPRATVRNPQDDLAAPSFAIATQ